MKIITSRQLVALRRFVFNDKVKFEMKPSNFACCSCTEKIGFFTHFLFTSIYACDLKSACNLNGRRLLKVTRVKN